MVYRYCCSLLVFNMKQKQQQNIQFNITHMSEPIFQLNWINEIVKCWFFHSSIIPIRFTHRNCNCLKKNWWEDKTNFLICSLAMHLMLCAFWNFQMKFNRMQILSILLHISIPFLLGCYEIQLVKLHFHRVQFEFFFFYVLIVYTFIWWIEIY